MDNQPAPLKVLCQVKGTDDFTNRERRIRIDLEALLPSGGDRNVQRLRSVLQYQSAETADADYVRDFGRERPSSQTDV